MTDEPEREAGVELAEIVEAEFSAWGIDLELHLEEAAVNIATAMLEYFRPAVEVMDVDQQMLNLDLAAGEISAAEEKVRVAHALRRMHQEEALWRRQHPFRNLWAWARGL